MALTQYPVTVTGGIDTEFRSKTMWEVGKKVSMGKRPSECKVFCVHLNLKEVSRDIADKASSERNFLMSTICMVFLSGHMEGVTRKRDR
jgi:hypothetical protein